MCLARLMASVSAKRWCVEQTPLILLGRILPRSG